MRWVMAGIMLSFICAPAKADCLQLASDMHSPAIAVFATSISKHLNESGICNQIRSLPSKRSTAMMLSGHIDGEFFRVAEYRDVIGEHAQMVPTSLGSLPGYILSRSPHIDTIEKMQSKRLGTILGHRWQRQLSEQLFHVTETVGYANLIPMLEHGRIDAILIDDQNYQKYNKELQPYHISQVATLTLHLWIAKRHTAKIPALDQAIQTMRAQSGSPDSILPNG